MTCTYMTFTYMNCTDIDRHAKILNSEAAQATFC